MDKFEEDVIGRSRPEIRGDRRAVISFAGFGCGESASTSCTASDQLNTQQPEEVPAEDRE